MVKWPFLMAWSTAFLTVLKRAAWYHLARSVLILSDKALSATGCFFLGGQLGLLVRLTCHMPDVVDRLPTSIFIPSLTTLM